MKTSISTPLVVLLVLGGITTSGVVIHNFNKKSNEYFDSHVDTKYTVWRGYNQTGERVWKVRDQNGQEASSDIMVELAIQELENR